MMKYFKFVSVLLLFFVMFSCEKDTLSGSEEEQIESYITSKGLVVTEKTTTGLRYIRTKENVAGAMLAKGKTVTLTTRANC